MIIILYSQLITIASLYILVKYKKELFSNLFWLVLSGVLIAFIPNFATSLIVSTGTINIATSEVLFSLTGAIVLVFLWKVLSDKQC